MLVAFDVSDLQKQRSEVMVGQVISGHELDRMGIICNGRPPLPTAAVHLAKNATKRDHAGVRRNIADKSVGFVELVSREQHASSAKFGPCLGIPLGLLSHASLRLFG